ncbi:GNAT family protein [Halomonas shantousis]
MFYRYINDDLQVALTLPKHAEALFSLTDENRTYLKAWLPWLDDVKTANDTRRFIESNLESFASGTALHEVLLYQGHLVGVLGFNTIDNKNRIAQIGYWLGKAHVGKGLMTLAVDDLINLGFEELGLQRLEIRCATENFKSRAIPERLGFQHEGTLRSVEKVGEKTYSHAVYGLLREDVKN